MAPEPSLFSMLPFLLILVILGTIFVLGIKLALAAIRWLNSQTDKNERKR